MSDAGIHSSALCSTAWWRHFFAFAAVTASGLLSRILERQPAVPTTAGDPHSSKAARALHRAALEANCRIDPVPFVI
jgi:hypothetical protein